MVIAGSPCLESSRIIIHLGMNPVRGGRPPRERSMRGIIEVSTGVFVQDKVRELILVELLSLNVRKVAIVMTKYVSKARNVRDGQNWRTKIIHPRWAMEEYAKILRS